MPELAGQHALVTGGGRGIGRAIAALLSANGAAVTVLGRQEASLRDAVSAGHAQAYVIADVTDERAVTDAIAGAARKSGPIHILIANAGGAASAPFAKTSTAQFQQMLDLNLMGAVHAMHAVLGDMVARRSGRIVAIASTAGMKGYPYVTAYCAAKHAVVGLVRALAKETVKTGVTVNAICPGYTDTDLVRDSVAATAKKTGRPAATIAAEMLKDEPLGRLITPDEVAAAALFLCSPNASAITGATLAVAGGEI
ncbi:MAG TPA: SDR family NAD(P)-dependent oxidoreductase [Stellaceae bacterium]